MEKELLKLEHKIELTNKKLDDVLRYNKKQDENITIISEILRGNGNPQKGIVFEMAKIQEQLKSLCSTLKIHWGLFVVILTAIIKLAFFS